MVRIRLQTAPQGRWVPGTERAHNRHGAEEPLAVLGDAPAHGVLGLRVSRAQGQPDALSYLRHAVRAVPHAVDASIAPSMTMSAREMKSASDEARNAIVAATSPGLPSRSRGMASSIVDR